jgi:hypothetical protein
VGTELGDYLFAVERDPATARPPGRAHVLRARELFAQMSVWGQKQTLGASIAMSALPRKRTSAGIIRVSAECQQRNPR